MPDDTIPDDADAIAAERAAERAISEAWDMMPGAARSEREARRRAAREDFFRRRAVRRWNAMYRGRR